MADINKIAAAVLEFSQWSEYAEFWEGIARRLIAGVGLTAQEITALNGLIPAITEFKKFTYKSITV